MSKRRAVPSRKLSTQRRVSSDEIEDQVRRSSRELDQPLAPLVAEAEHDVVRVELEARDDLTAASARRTPARFRSLEQNYIAAGFGRVQRGRQPGEATADYADIRCVIAFELRVAGIVWCGGCPQRIR